MRELPPTAGLPLRATDLVPWGDGDLEAALAGWLRVPAPQLTCSGTAAFVVALHALRELKPERDEVVVPAYTCPLMALAVAHCGLRLRLCDLAPGSLDLDLQHLRALCGERTLAVVPTHLCGLVTDVAGPATVARAAGAWVIEDAAQALGARACGEPVGLQADVGFYSLAAGKGLTLYEGGLLITHDMRVREALRRSARQLIATDAGWELRRSIELLGYAAFYRPRTLPWFYGRPLRQALAQGDRIAAAGDDFDDLIPLHAVGRWRQRIGVRALPRLALHLQEGRKRWQRRSAVLADCAGVQVLGDSPVVPQALGVRPLLLLALPSAGIRETLLHRLWGSGRGVSLPFAATLADYPRHAAIVPRAQAGELPHARDFAARLLAITNSAWLDDSSFMALAMAIGDAITEAAAETVSGLAAPRARAAPLRAG